MKSVLLSAVIVSIFWTGSFASDKIEVIMDIEKFKEEIKQADLAFSAMSVEQGMQAAFDYYMAENAVIYRPEAKVYEGREAILPLFPADKSSTLKWEPTYVDVAASGDLGYSLGKYTYTLTDPEGKRQESKGHYVTIWKRQTDGTWKYVFDTGN